MLKRFSNGIKYLPFLLILLVLVLTFFFTNLITEAWWFSSVNYFSVFTTALTWKIFLGSVVFVIVASVLYLNFFLANAFTKYNQVNANFASFAQVTGTMLHLTALAFSVLVAYAWANTLASDWQVFAEFWHRSQSGLSDPIFSKDMGFYFFELPLYQTVRKILLNLSFFSLAISLAIYLLKGAIRLIQGWKNLFSGAVKTHITILLTIIVFLIAWGFWLDRYQILYSSSGIFFGAGYTDVNARIAGFYLMTAVTLLSGLLLLISVFRKDIFLLAAGLATIVVALVLVLGIYPWAQQKFIVEPNELEKEKPFIAHNINFTRKAYGLDNVERHNYSIEANASLEGIASITNNIRLWDWQPLLDTYRQIQEMRLYYRFHDVDPDRYVINGKYLQVMTAARELDYARIPQQARTWVNTHIKYTHGYGMVMSPVDEVTPQGMPRLWIKDIPPVSSAELKIDLKIDRPEIYYGELTSEYIFTGTTTEEFDYPMGDKNSFTRYQGKGGVKLDSIWKRLLYATQFKTMKLLISEYITSNTKIHYHRTIRERVQKIAPFLRYDKDPYLSVVDGRLLWIIDAYTVSGRFPYAERVGGSQTNYVRNSVKVTIDAYDGTMQFYIVDENDILAKTYAAIYPQLFKNLADVPMQVKQHFHYPEDLFQIQASMYSSYHMSDTSVFYNREDMWRMPLEMYQGEEKNLEPYYLIMPLPNEKKHEYLLIMPFTPVKKNNMIAWMTARSDGENYGKLVLYEFPKKELVYGPMQIEARIDQDPNISELLTLWSQKGSKVIRGNLIVIPYQGNLLYVEPLYLRAEQAQMPELKRVIIAYKNKIVISETLNDSLSQVLGQSVGFGAEHFSATGETVASGINDKATLQQLIEQALRSYENSQAALNKPDWTRYGESQKQLKNVLERMQSLTEK